MEQEGKVKKLDPRQKAGLILGWARDHIPNPCGGTLREKAFMQGLHRRVVKEALEEPGIPEALTDEEKIEIRELLPQ